MDRRLKLTLAGAGFLGSNGALIPVINSNFSFTDFSLKSLGGGIPNTVGLTTRNYETPQINLDDSKTKAPSIDLESSKSDLQIPKLNLEDRGENSLNISFKLSPEKENYSSISSSIGKIHTEIKREGTVQGIEQTLESQYQTQFSRQLDSSRSKQQEHLRNYQEAKQLIHSSPQQETSSSSTRRSRREVLPTKKPLTQSQREALLKMFNLHDKLTKESQRLNKELEKEFFNGLRESLQTQIKAPLKSEVPTASEIQASLRTIGWTSRAIKTQKDRDRGSTRFFNPKSWGEWNANPFRHFFQEEKEFTTAISTQQKLAQKAEHAEQLQLRMQSGYRGQFLNQYEANMKKIQEQKSSTGAHIEHKIASKLLEYMGQGLTS